MNETDPRDCYPSVNAINLLIQKGDGVALKEAERLLPLVSFAAARRRELEGLLGSCHGARARLRRRRLGASNSSSLESAACGNRSLSLTPFSRNSQRGPAS